MRCAGGGTGRVARSPAKDGTESTGRLAEYFPDEFSSQGGGRFRFVYFPRECFDRSEGFSGAGDTFRQDRRRKLGWPWHQDLAIAVDERIETAGFGPWSVKEGVVHVQPPPHILARMVTLRLHLDDCTAENGALRVLPGSHGQGELDADAIADWTARQPPVVCEIPKGGALLMRPLLLHASSPAKNPSHRRVLHVEYAAAELPNGLKWSERP